MSHKIVEVLGDDGDFLLVADEPPNDRIWVGYAVNPIVTADAQPDEITA